jgi:Protein of unknown function (DUF3108)
MDDIARKQSGDAQSQLGPRCGSATRSNARAGVLWCATLGMLALFGLAIVAPITGRAASDSAPDPSNPRPHKHRHHATATPTPMALPPEVKAKVPVYNPVAAPFHDGEELTYQASWLGIPAAEARVLFRKKIKDPSRKNLQKNSAQNDPAQRDSAQKDQSRDDPTRSDLPRERWIAEVWVQTTPYADMFYKMRDYVRESVAEDTLHTGNIHIDQHENSRLYSYDVAMDRPAQMVTVTANSKHGTQVKQFIASDPFGPLSGAMMALSQDLTPGHTYAFDVFGGSQRYVFSFDVQERERIHTVLGDFDAFKIVPDVWYVSDGKLRRQAHGTVLWVSADKRHLPLRIQSEAFIGSVYADLIKVDGVGPAGSS